MCQGRSTPYIEDGHPTFNRESLINLGIETQTKLGTIRAPRRFRICGGRPLPGG